MTIRVSEYRFLIPLSESRAESREPGPAAPDLANSSSSKLRTASASVSPTQSRPGAIRVPVPIRDPGLNGHAHLKNTIKARQARLELESRGSESRISLLATWGDEKLLAR